jgi:hypothetical protein
MYFPEYVLKNYLIKFAEIEFTKLIISYDNLYYTTYEDQAARTVSRIIGEIGGQLSNFFVF